MRPLPMRTRAEMEGEGGQKPQQACWGSGGIIGKRGVGTAGAKAGQQLGAALGRGSLLAGPGALCGGSRAVGDETEGQEGLQRPQQGESLCPPWPQGPCGLCPLGSS